MRNRLTHFGIGFILIFALAGITYAAAQITFSDVDPNAWYADGVSYASNKGLMTGYSDGTFGPENPVLRGELATILQRFDERTLASQTANFTNVLCDLGKRVKLYEDPATKQILYGVGDFSSGIVETTRIYNTAGEKVGSIIPSDVEGEADSCTLNDGYDCATFKAVICEGIESL